MIRWPALLLLGLLSLATPAFAGGVDCNKAADPIDKKVCADPGLLRAEEKLADVFAARKALSPDPGAEQQSQTSWRVLRQDYASTLLNFYQGRIKTLQDEIAEQRNEAPIVAAEDIQKNCIWFRLSPEDQMFPFASRRQFRCQVDAFGEIAGSRDSITGPLYYQFKSYDGRGGTGFAIFEPASSQKDHLKLLMAVNREQVIRYAAPLVRADSEKRAWLVVSGQIQGSASGLDGTSLYLFKEGLPQIVEGDEAGQRLKSLLSERR